MQASAVPRPLRPSSTTCCTPAPAYHQMGTYVRVQTELSGPWLGRAPALRSQPACAEKPERTEATQDKPPPCQLARGRGWRCYNHLASMLRRSQLPQAIPC